jgi:hypothetical protein
MSEALRLSRISSKKMGSWLVTALLVLGVLLTIIAVATPNLLRSRMAVNQAAEYGKYAPARATDAAMPAGAMPVVMEVRRVIRTGGIDLIVAAPEEALEQVRSLATRMGGFVESAQLSDPRSAQPYGMITIRVPADRYDDARREVRGLGQRVENERDEARDVTGQYVDLESSLRNFRAEEAQYLEIMRRAGSIKDTLAVAERLADVRGRIERTQGQLNLLARQAEMASLAVTLRTEPVVQPTTVRWHPAAELKAAFWDAADNLATYANFMIAVLFRLPVMLLWMVTVVAGVAAAWKMLRWMWRRLFATAPAAA